MGFCSDPLGPLLCSDEYSGTSVFRGVFRTGTNHPGWVKCLAVTETMSVFVNICRSTCELVSFFSSIHTPIFWRVNLKPVFYCLRTLLISSLNLLLISLHLFMLALLIVSLVYFLRPFVVFLVFLVFWFFNQMFCCAIPNRFFCEYVLPDLYTVFPARSW